MLLLDGLYGITRNWNLDSIVVILGLVDEQVVMDYTWVRNFHHSMIRFCLKSHYFVFVSMNR